jgi:hypothetical protein
LSGLAFDFDTGDASRGTLGELVLGSNYVEGDATFELLAGAGANALVLQIQDGVNAGVYRIVAVDQTGASPVLTVTPAVLSPVAANARWRILSNIDVALDDVKETRVSGSDLSTVQNQDTVTTASAVDFDALGVSKGDVLRILVGPDKGDYAVVEDPLSPGFTSLRLDTVFSSSQSNLRYTVFRPNVSGSLVLPLVRIESIALLDSSKQPIGTTIPYARPVDIQSRAFQNPARGVKHDVTDAPARARVGGSGQRLCRRRRHTGAPVAPGQRHGGLLGGAAAHARPGRQRAQRGHPGAGGEAGAVIPLGPDRFGIRPFGEGGFVATSGDNATVQALFGGTDEQRTSRDIRSATIDGEGGWESVSPLIDFDTGLDIVQLLDGNQIGFVPGPFVVEANVLPATRASTALAATSGQVFYPEFGVHLQVGARSIGSARLFFLDPTSVEVRSGETFFSLETAAGLVRFTPDPTLDSQRIPAPPGGTKPTDGQSADFSNVFTSASQDFVLSAIAPGDELVIDYHPISGTRVLADPVAGLVNLTLVFSVDGSPDKTLVFIRDDVTLAVTEVSRQGIADQINAAAGLDIASITSDERLEFEADASIVIRNTGTANSLILDELFGTGESFVLHNQRNTAPHAGTFSITSVSPQSLTVTQNFDSGIVDSPFTSPFTREQFKVFRKGIQRIVTTAMKQNTAAAGLYFFDVELVSEGTGDLFNIAADQQLTVEGLESDGYFLTTEDPNLSFSPIERPRLHVSKSILEDGVDDDPSNATQLAGQNILVTYDRASLVEDAQNFVSSETERVICDSPLSRHLIPHFVRFDLTYVGGSREDVVTPDIEDYITGLAPTEALESSDLQKIASGRGATSIDNPIDLIAIVHNPDRTITAARSQNRLTTGRLAAFIPDLLTIKRNLT